MCVLTCLRIVSVTKACLIGELCDRAFVADEKVPGVCRTPSSVLVEVLGFFLCRSSRRFRRVDADIDDLKISAHVQRQLLKCMNQPVVD